MWQEFEEKERSGWAWWIIPIIQATWEAEVGLRSQAKS
jgi:hypothetical protein